jgi:hypothetical protein
VLGRAWYDRGIGVRVHTLGGDGESFTFVDHAYLRIGPDRVDASGDLRAMRLKVDGSPRLFVGDTPAASRIEGGVLVFGP